MKKFLVLIGIILASAQVGRSQCAPQNPTGNIGFFPATDQLPCVERGVYYDETFYLENVDSFRFQGFGTLTVDTFRIDSIVNLPCNLKWISDRGDNTYYRAETGCIRVFGQTDDTIGQYELKVYVTIKSGLLGTLQGNLDEIVTNLQNLAGNLGIDFEYFIRVKETGTPCPNIDRSANSPRARTAKGACPAAGVIAAHIVGDTALCRGTNGQLSLQLSNVATPAVLWSPASAVTNPSAAITSLALTQSGYVTVVVTDTASSGNSYVDRVWVQVDTASPVATVLTTINGQSIKLESTSPNATDYVWTLGDQTTANGRVVLHTYAANGIYPVSLTASNTCGTDTYLDTLYIGNVGIKNISAPALQSSIYPNPAKGTVAFTIEGLQQFERYTVTVTDASGKQALNPLSLVYQLGAPVSLSIETLPVGIYIFRIETLHSNFIHKLVIY